MRKKYSGIIILLIVMFFSFAVPVNAQQTEEMSNPELSIEAPETDEYSVTVYDVKVEKKDSRKINVTFDVVNEGKHDQAGLRFGVYLLSEKEEAADMISYKETADFSISPEVFSVVSGKKIKKNFEYEIPSVLKGEFFVEVRLYNTQGKYFSSTVANDYPINMQAEEKMAGVVLNGCYAGIDEENGKKYSLSEGVDVSSDEKLYIACMIQSVGMVKEALIPKVKIYKRNIFSDSYAEKELEAVSIVKNGEQRFYIPMQMDPQAYDVEIGLQGADKKNASNHIVAHFVLRGESGTVSDVKFDKASFLKGETMNIKTEIYGNAGFFPDSRNFDLANLNQIKEQRLSYDVTVVDESSDEICGEKKNMPIDIKETGSFIESDITAIKNCANPKAKVVLKGNAGRILYEASFGAGSASGKIIEEKKVSKSSWLSIEALILALIASIILLFFLFRNKKTSLSILLLAIVSAGVLGLSPNKASASYFTLHTPWSEIGFAGVFVYVYYQTDKQDYAPGEKVSISNELAINSCANGAMSASSKINGKEISNQCAGGCSKRQVVTLTAPNTPGRYCYNVEGRSWHYNMQDCESVRGEKRGSYCLQDQRTEKGCYNVVAPPVVVNGACGTANGGTYTSAPTSGLCSSGSASSVSGSGPWNWSCNGSGGGSNAFCSASKYIPVINGACGTRAKAYLASTTNWPIADTWCGTGTLSAGVPFPSVGQISASWICQGSGGGTSSEPCTASRDYYICNGSGFSKAAMCPGEGNQVMTPTNTSLISSCATPPQNDSIKCEWGCLSGYQKVGNACTCIPNGCPENTCIGNKCNKCNTTTGEYEEVNGTKDCRNENWQEVSPN